ncbi:unnamed protein product [Periconia digitata]|uniref:Uncharacterized protein n=1 Tax=Periconia digitata TaxID=1303443 RepID=A0A9W4U3H1_9PLEO|nr:unnamed protein product [Periconia digitata]
MNLSREPCKPPEVPRRFRGSRRQIFFRHPRYHNSNNVLLKLFAPDVGQSSQNYSLYAGYALQACGIIAGNCWDRWLLEARDSNSSALVNSTSTLDKSSYYFHLPLIPSNVNASLPYPIVPTFRKWRFPHD